MREIFESIDVNHDGILDLDELCVYIKSENAEEYDPLVDAKKVQADAFISKFAKEVMSALKKLAHEVGNPNIKPNSSNDILNWVEFHRYKQVCKLQKVELQSVLTGMLHKQKMEMYQLV